MACAAGQCNWQWRHSCGGRYADGGFCGELPIDCKAGAEACCRVENEIEAEERRWAREDEVARLSKTMQTAMKLAGRNGALERWRGGWWTYPGAAVARYSEGYAIPEEHTGAGTIHALIDRGLLFVATPTARNFRMAALRASS